MTGRCRSTALRRGSAAGRSRSTALGGRGTARRCRSGTDRSRGRGTAGRRRSRSTARRGRRAAVVVLDLANLHLPSRAAGVAPATARNHDRSCTSTATIVPGEQACISGTHRRKQRQRSCNKTTNHCHLLNVNTNVRCRRFLLIRHQTGTAPGHASLVLFRSSLVVKAGRN